MGDGDDVRHYFARQVVRDAISEQVARLLAWAVGGVDPLQSLMLVVTSLS